MQTDIENTDTSAAQNGDANANSNTYPVASRLARMPHVINLPPDPPKPRELKRLIEARLAELNAQQLRLNLRDDDEAVEYAVNKSILSILSILHQHLTELRQQFPDIDAPIPPPTPVHHPAGSASLTSAASLTSQKISHLSETTETALPYQQLPAETQSGLTETELRPTETAETGPRPADTHSSPSSESEPAAHAHADPGASDDQDFESKLQKLPAHLRKIAADLYEHLHYRSKFAKLTSEQRDTIYALNSPDHSVYEVLEIVAQPPPIGMNFHTSRAGMFRFCADYRQILNDRKTLESQALVQQQRLADEQAFQTANASDETFRQITERQIRKLLFAAINNSKPDHHQIRWLLKSLEMLRPSKSS